MEAFDDWKKVFLNCVDFRDWDDFIFAFSRFAWNLDFTMSFN
jgi:hypothetical protein